MSDKPRSPFDALKALRDALPPGPEAKPAVAGPGQAAAPVPKGPARAVVRYERKGRGGKEATLVEKLGLPARELERWCGDLKKALGCGGKVDGDDLVLQGDQRARLPELLEARGVRKVTVS
jgi:translation initiation factor 1